MTEALCRHCGRTKHDHQRKLELPNRGIRVAGKPRSLATCPGFQRSKEDIAQEQSAAALSALLQLRRIVRSAARDRPPAPDPGVLRLPGPKPPG